MAVFFSVQALAGGECSAWISLNMTCSSASYHDEQPMFSGHNFLNQSFHWYAEITDDQMMQTVFYGRCSCKPKSSIGEWYWTSFC